MKKRIDALLREWYDYGYYEATMQNVQMDISTTQHYQWMMDNAKKVAETIAAKEILDGKTLETFVKWTKKTGALAAILEKVKMDDETREAKEAELTLAIAERKAAMRKLEKGE